MTPLFRQPAALAAWLAGAALASTQAQSAMPTPALPPASAAKAPAQACPAILQHTALRLQDEKPQSLCQYSGQVVVVVNTASFCGFTPQYKSLEALYARYKGQGLVVLGFPSNDFAQETGSNQDIADFCENTFGVKFPMFTKTRVRGRDASALFQQLAGAAGMAPQWNFYKYVISRDGKAVSAFKAGVSPDSRPFTAQIEAELAKR